VGETRVDLLHLLEDLRDAYPGAIEETIVTEVVANSLDSGASLIRLHADPAQTTLTVVDDGAGMRRHELRRYHDVAATSKTRGQGIGFAGVGIKLGLLVSHEVVTESRRGTTHVATRWHLASRHRAPWRWTTPLGLCGERGTAVQLQLQNPLSPLLDIGYVEAVLVRQYRPLLDPTFDVVLAAHYPRGVRLEINGRPLERRRWTGTETVPIQVRLARKRKPSAVGVLVRESGPLPEGQRGVAVSTYGKVIKQGWDWLGLTPAEPDRVAGLIEVPPLAESLTLNKADFIRTGPRGATYLAYRKAIQERVAEQLAKWGDSRGRPDEERRRAARPVERDLERVLVEMADDFPLLATLVERHAGGQRRLPVGSPVDATDVRALIASAVTGVRETAEADRLPPREAKTEAAERPETAASPEPALAAAEPPAPAVAVSRLAGPGGPKRPGRYGLSIQFEARPGDPELGRLVESTVYVNDAHPAYRRAAASRSEGYHLALAVALALAPLAAGAVREHDFVTAFLARWGEALRSGARRARGRR
jgi:Histidine kinase-, DNA gyrase B-, and HSP90-like ATPase